MSSKSVCIIPRPVIPRYSEGSGRFGGGRRSFGVPQDDNAHASAPGHAQPYGRCQKASRLRGFSLIEFTVVLALIGLLAGIVTIGVRPLMTRGKQNTARAEIATICTALESFYTIYGRYPSNDEGVMILTQKSEKVGDPLLTQVPLDPWGRPYQYNMPGRNQAYEVVCLGADGREGGSGGDADVVSWDLKEKQGKAP